MYRREQKKPTGLGQSIANKRQPSYAGNGGDAPFSQDQGGFIPDHNGGEEDICFKCQKGGGENWVACDSCNKWFHILCVDLDKLPGDDEPFVCKDCQKK